MWFLFRFLYDIPLHQIPYGAMVSITAFQASGRGSNPCVGVFFILIYKSQITGNYLGYSLKNQLIFSCYYGFYSIIHAVVHPPKF